MSHENEIPEYAMQPARAPKTTEAEAIYHIEKAAVPEEEMKVTYQFEEDILVPDIKPDMREILIMDGDCDFSPAAKKIVPKTDDLLNITGTITLQTIYAGEGDGQEPVAITSKVPYKYQWAVNPAQEAEGVFCCRVKNLAYMIINERKFRVKVTLEFTARLFVLRTFSLFQGLKDDSLEMRMQQTGLAGMELVKRDGISVDETFLPKDREKAPRHILKQDFTIVENYRQITTEKIVLNGFIYCSILYTAGAGVAGESDGATICQHNQRVEFTQFIPIEREHRQKTWSAVKSFYGNSGLTVTIARDEENPDEVCFRLQGEIKTRIECYQRRNLELVRDAYHREKNFICDVSKVGVQCLSESAMGETTIREMINLPEGMRAKEAVYCIGKITESNCACEKGRLIANGKVLCSALWKDETGDFHVEKHGLDFRGTVELETLRPEQNATVNPIIKSAWVEMISERQIEINCSILLCADVFEEEEIVQIANPRFVGDTGGRQYPMVIVSVSKDDSLWTLAKRYRTTEENIRKANQLDGEPEIGRRILIIK